MPIFGAKSRAMRGCASKLACGRRIDPADCTVFTVICGEFVTSQRVDVGIDPYNKIGNRLRIRRKFSCRCNISRRADKASAPASKQECAYGFAANFHRKAGVHFEKMAEKFDSCAGICRRDPWLGYRDHAAYTPRANTRRGQNGGDRRVS